MPVSETLAITFAETILMCEPATEADIPRNSDRRLN